MHGCHPKILRTDDSATFKSDVMKEYLFKGWKCVHQSSVPYSKWQNAVEREVQTVVNGTSVLLHSQQFLRADCWDLALSHYLNIKNRCPNSRSIISPHQQITKDTLDFERSFKFSFGDIVAVALPGDEKQKEWKFDTKNEIGIYVGQADDSKDGNRIYWPFSGAIQTRMHCWKLAVTDKQFMQYYNARLLMRAKPTSYVTVKDAIHDFESVGPIVLEDLEALGKQIPKLSEELMDIEEDDPLADVYNSPSRVPAECEVEETVADVLPEHLHREAPHRGRVFKKKRVSPLKRKKRISTVVPDMESSQGSPDLTMGVPRVNSEPAKSSTRSGKSYSDAVARSATETYEDFLNVYGAYVYQFMYAYASKETVGSALKSPLRDSWISAIRDEILHLLSGGTLEETGDDQIVGPHRVIHSTLQLKHKKHQDQTTDKFKARLCACGNELYGLVAETFSPTIGVLAYATVHQVAVIDNMYKQTVDTVGAYLHQKYPDDATPLYIVIDDKVAAACGLRTGVKYRVRKYLYGLPDAGVAYYKAYSTHLIASGYERSMSDPCLFIRKEGPIRTYVWTHVDDTFVCSTSEAELDRFSDKLRERFEITVVKEVKEYLGIAITRQPNGDTLLTQPKLLGSLLSEYKEELSKVKVKGVVTPLRLYNVEDVVVSEKIKVTDYLHLLGALIYLCKSRPDISTAVSFAATFAASPTVLAFKELLLILKYLEHTREKGLLLKTGDPGRDLRLTCYVDASYLTHRDSKSHTGYTLSFGEIGTFYSKSGKQTLVATSSTHAEMRAVYSLIVDIIFVVHLCIELGRPVKLPCVVMEDNSAVISVTSSAGARVKQCKHFLMLVHYVREQVIAGLIEIRKVDTKYNIADVLTKIVTGLEFTTKADLLLGRNAM